MISTPLQLPEANREFLGQTIEPCLPCVRANLPDIQSQVHDSFAMMACENKQRGMDCIMMSGRMLMIIWIYEFNRKEEWFGAEKWLWPHQRYLTALVEKKRRVPGYVLLANSGYNSSERVWRSWKKRSRELGALLRTISRMVHVKFVSLSARTSITREWSMKAEYRATIPRQFRWAFCVAVKSLAALSTHYGEKSQTPGVINNTTLRSTYFVLVVTRKSLLRFS